MNDFKSKKGLVFIEATKVRKTKKGDLMIFLNEKTVIVINKNYAMTILNSEDQSDRKSSTEEGNQ